MALKAILWSVVRQCSEFAGDQGLQKGKKQPLSYSGLVYHRILQCRWTFSDS